MAKEKGKKKGGDKVEVVPAPPPRLSKAFDEVVAPKLDEQFGIKNRNARPKLEKITINVSMGRHLDGTKVPANITDTVAATLRTISGQKPILIHAKKSVSNFKVRVGYPTAYKVTLRRDRMWHFLDRLIHLATPRIKDFRGLSRKGFDGAGNYSFGLTEQGVFPEINMAEVNFTHGMNINLSFKNSDKARSEFALEALGMPFEKIDEEGR